MKRTTASPTKSTLLPGIIITSLCLLLAFCFPQKVFAVDTELRISQYHSITAAIQAIQPLAGKVLILIDEPPSELDPTEIVIPTDKNIEEISIKLGSSISALTIKGINSIFANGIPLRIGAGITLEECSLYGGAHAVDETEIIIPSSNIILEGTADYLFGGGLAENGAQTTITDSSNVTLEKDALVLYEVFGAGHASGQKSCSSVTETQVLIKGTTDYVLGAGFAEDGGKVESEKTIITIAESGRILVGLFSGGSAAGTGSHSILKNALTTINGYAEMAFSGDFAFAEGQTELTSSGRLVVESTGECGEAVAGSFASDKGSQAHINTAELMLCGKAGSYTLNSMAADGGIAKTIQVAHFPCTQ